MIGGDLALDFVNTVGDQGKSRQIDWIADWPALSAWMAAAGLADPGPPPGEDGGAEVLGALYGLRAQAYPVLAALAAGAAPPRDAWAALEQRFRAATARSRLAATEAGFAWEPEDTTGAGALPDRLALSLEALLRRPDLDRLRQCARCTWLFLDHGRGRGRRWCSMRVCGNRAKAEAFRHR